MGLRHYKYLTLSVRGLTLLSKVSPRTERADIDSMTTVNHALPAFKSTFSQQIEFTKLTLV